MMLICVIIIVLAAIFSPSSWQIISGLAGVFHLATVIAILVHVHYKRKDFPNIEFCCFSKNTEEAAVASTSTSVDQNSRPIQAAEEDSTPVPADSIPQQVNETQSECEVSGLNAVTIVSALENVGPTQSKDPHLPSSPALMLVNTETELRETAPPSYQELYGVRVSSY